MAFVLTISFSDGIILTLVFLGFVFFWGVWFLLWWFLCSSHESNSDGEVELVPPPPPQHPELPPPPPPQQQDLPPPPPRQQPALPLPPPSQPVVCTVCQEDIQSNERIRVLSCGHMYHLHCIHSWLIEKMECPLCKKAVPETEEPV